MQLANCPSETDLRAYLLGSLDPASIDSLSEHIAGCKTCLPRLEQVPEGDPFVGLLRNGGKTPLPKNAMIDQLKERLRRLKPPAVDFDTAGAGALSTSGGNTERLGPEEWAKFLAPAQAPGEMGRLGNYRVLSILGQGGMGVVFLAEDVFLKRRVALKVMRSRAADDPKSRERFLREAQAMAKLLHDHIVPVFQWGQGPGGSDFFAMPLLQGESLEDRLRKEPRLPVGEVLRVGREAAMGLEAAHAAGVAHRDVKPSNLWLEAPGGRVKLLDFGLSRPQVNPEGQLTQAGVVLGTPGYMAPEQIEGVTDPRSDLYSLGCVLYRMATGQLPIGGDGAMRMLKNTLTQPPTPPRQLRHDLPEGLEKLLLQLLDKDPARRPASAQAVVDAIRALERSPQGRAGAALPAPDAPTVPLRQPLPVGTPAVPPRLLIIAGVAGGSLVLGLFLLVALSLPSFKGRPAGGVAQNKDKGPGGGGDNGGEGDGSRPGGLVRFLDDKPKTEPMNEKTFVTTPLKIKGVSTWMILADAKSRGPARLRFGGTPERPLLYVSDYSWVGSKLGAVDVKADAGTAMPYQGEFLAVAPDGKSFARQEGVNAGTVDIWKAGEDHLARRLRGSDSVIRSALFFPGGKRVLATNQSGYYLLWDLESTDKPQHWGMPSSQFRVALDQPFADEGRSAILVTDKGFVAVDTRTGAQVREMPLLDPTPTGQAVLTDVNVSPDGRWMAHFWRATPSSDLEVHVRETADAALFLRLKCQTGHYLAKSVGWSPDSKKLAYVDEKNQIAVIEVESKHEVWKAPGHVDGTYSVRFAPNGRTVVSSGADHTVRFWHGPTGALKSTLMFLPRNNWVAISPQGYYRGSKEAEGYLTFVVKFEGGEVRDLPADKFASLDPDYKNREDVVKMFGE